MEAVEMHAAVAEPVVEPKPLPALSPEEKALLRTLQDKPGLHVRDYVKMTKIPQQARVQRLKQIGLIRGEGHTSAARMFPTTRLDPNVYPNRKESHYDAKLPKAILRYVKEHPGSTGAEIAEGTGFNPTGTLTTAQTLAITGKLRTEGTPRSHGSNRLRFYPRGYHRAAPKVEVTPASVVVKGDAVAKLAAIVERSKWLEQENAALEKENKQLQTELESYAKVKELLGL